MSYINDLISESYNTIGTPFWEGEFGPDYFDRSGLVYYLYNTVGVPISYKPVTQLFSDPSFEDVSENSRRTGDLIFYGEPGFPKDVAIYLNDDYVIVCTGGDSTSKGKDDNARVFLKKITFKNNIIAAKRHYVFVDFHNSLQTDYYEDTMEHDDNANLPIETDADNSGLTKNVSFIIKTVAYDESRDREVFIYSFFEKLVTFDENQKGSFRVDSTITRKVNNNIELYKDERNLGEEELDILEHMIEPRNSELFMKFKENDSTLIYSLYGDVLVYSVSQIITLEKPFLTYEVINNDISLTWSFEKKMIHAYSYEIMMNGEKVDEGTSVAGAHVISNAPKGEMLTFSIVIKHPVGGVAESNSVTLILEERIKRNLFKNKFNVTPYIEHKSDYYSFYIKGDVLNEEYPVKTANVILSAKRILSSPEYPANIFDVELIGELFLGTEFYYDIEVEVQKQDGSFTTARKSFEYFNQITNGEPTNLITLEEPDGSILTVEEKMLDAIEKVLDEPINQMNDRITPKLFIDYQFINKTPLDVTVELSSSKTLQTANLEETSTEVFAEIVVNNTENWSISDFMTLRGLYCPDGNTSAIRRLVVRESSVDKQVSI